MGESILKKILSLILTVLLIMPQVYAAAEENRSRAVDFICLIGLMVGDDSGSFRENDYITRAEAARVLCELADDAVISGSLPSDIEESAWYKPYVDKAVGTGIMQNISGGMFMPLQNATADEMMRALLYILGYNNAMSATAKAELVRGLGLGTASNISRGQFAGLVYNALYMDTVAISYDGTEYAKSGVTLLEKYLYKTDRAIYRGVVQSTDRGSVITAEAEDEGYATLSGVRYNSAHVPNITDFLGKSVDFIAEFSENNASPVLLGVTEYKNDSVEICRDDVENISAEKITYLDDNDRRKTLRLDSGVKFVYNNFLVENISDSDMVISNGSYVLLDNDNNGRYDFIFAKEYRSFVVKEVSEFLSTIYFESGSWNGRKSISAQSLSGKDYDCRITDIDGNDIAVSSIKKNDAVTVFSDKAGRWVNVVVSDKKAVGTPQSIDEETAVIDGVEYRLGKDENGAALYKFDGITSGEYIIDAYGNLIGMIETGEESNYAYVTGVYESEDSDSAFEIRLVIGGHIEKQEQEDIRDLPTYLVGNKAMGLYKAAENIRVNKSKTGYEEASSLKDTFIKYKLDQNGRISHIETLDSGMILTERSFNPDILSFGGLFYIDQTTQVVCVPKNSDIGMEDYYKQLILEKSQSYRILGYDIDKDTKLAKAVFLNETMRLQEPGVITKSTKYSVVEKAGSVLSDGDPVYMLRVWNDGEQKELYSSGNAAVDEIIDRLKFGDCIYYSTNSLGQVDNVQLIASLKDEKPFVKNLRSENECIFGRLYTVKKKELSDKTNTEVNTFGVSVNGNGTDIAEYTVDDTKTPKIYYVDMAQKSIRPISVKELAAYSEFGDDAMQIFVAKKQYAVSAVVAVR